MSQALGLPLSLLVPLHSCFNAWRLAVDVRRRSPARRYSEQAAGQLLGLSAEIGERIAALRGAYGVTFEQYLNRANALENYLYLDLLHQLKSRASGAPAWPAAGLQLLDVGCKNFYYLRALAAAFEPTRLRGIELEGHRRYRDGYSRSDYAAHYVANVPGASFEVADVRAWREPVDVVTCWYPFVSPQTVLAWGLPLSVFDPQAFFAQLARCVAAGGHLFMVNQGVAEWQLARQWLGTTSLVYEQHLVIEDPLLPRPAPPVISWWRQS